MGDPDEKIFNGTCGEPVCLEIRGNRKNGIQIFKKINDHSYVFIFSNIDRTISTLVSRKMSSMDLLKMLEIFVIASPTNVTLKYHRLV